MARREIYQLGYHFIQNQLSRRDALLSLSLSHCWPRYTYAHVNQPHGNGRRTRTLCLTALHCICSPLYASVSLSSRACRSRSQSSNRYRYFLPTRFDVGQFVILSFRSSLTCVTDPRPTNQCAKHHDIDAHCTNHFSCAGEFLLND